MTEEFVTKSILRYLIDRGWQIIAFDFPQSGTGRSLHPNGSTSKNEGVLIPDIVAIKGNVCLYLENKDHYYKPDFVKVYEVISKRQYSDAFSSLLGRADGIDMYGGIGLPVSSLSAVADVDKGLVNVIFDVNDDGVAHVAYCDFEMV